MLEIALALDSRTSSSIELKILENLSSDCYFIELKFHKSIFKCQTAKEKMKSRTIKAILIPAISAIISGIVLLLVGQYLSSSKSSEPVPAKPAQLEEAKKEPAPHDASASHAPTSSDPDVHNKYLTKGNQYYNLADYDEAIHYYKLAAEAKPDFAEAFFSLGNVYHKLKNYDKAVYYYTRAVELQPQYAEAHSGLGRAYNNLREFDKAIDSFKKAIACNPKYDKAYRSLGNVYYNTGEYQLAVDQFKRAVEINPQSAETYFDLGDAYRQLQDWSAAAEAYQQYLRLDASNTQAQERLQEMKELAQK